MLERLLYLDSVQSCSETDVSSSLSFLDRTELRLTAGKCILIRRPGMVRNLYPALLLYWAMVQVYIGAFIKAVMRGPGIRRGEVVMDICEANQALDRARSARSKNLQRRQGHLALLRRHLVNDGKLHAEQKRAEDTGHTHASTSETTRRLLDISTMVSIQEYTQCSADQQRL